MIRWLFTFAALAFLGRGYLQGAGVPVDSILGHGAETIGAAFSWNKYDFAAMGTILSLAGYSWWRRPQKLRFVSRWRDRRAARVQEAEVRARTHPMLDFKREALQDVRDKLKQIEKAMREGSPGVMLYHVNDATRPLIEAKAREIFGSHLIFRQGDHADRLKVRWDVNPGADFSGQEPPKTNPFA
jgi:hypothetical protein